MLKVLIMGLGNPAIPEQMDAPEKSTPVADNGGGGTAFSDIMTRVSEKKGVETKTGAENEKSNGDAVSEEKSEKTAEQGKIEKKKKIVNIKEKVEEKTSEDRKAAGEGEELSLASMLLAGDKKGVEKPESADHEAAKTDVNEKAALQKESVKIDSSENGVRVQMAFTGNERLTPNPEKKKVTSSEQDVKEEKSKVKIIDTRGKKEISGEKQVKHDKGVELEKPLSDESARERQFTVIERGSGEGKERELFRPVSSQITKSDQNMLFKHLQETVNDRIVRQAGIILKDNNSGELRLVLKPEKMGTVRIRLELQDNHIAGKIFVDNSSVKDVFDHNLEALYRAFRDNGYETSGLNVAVGNGNGGDNGKPGRGIPKGTLKMLEDFVPSADEIIHADYLVNLVV